MSTTLDDRIREAVAELAESVDEPEPFPGMPLARRPIPWWRRPVVASAAAAMVVVVLVGVPLFLVYGGDEVTILEPTTTGQLEPTTSNARPVVAYRFAYHELDGPPIGESVMVPIVVFEPAVGDDPLRTVERVLSKTFPFHWTTVPLISQHGAIDIDGFEVDPTAAWWPLGIRLTGVSLDGSLLTVRVSKEWGAITRVPDQLPPATVVFAATQFDFVDSVQIEVAGEMLGGGPFTRADYDQVNQGVFLETPAVRQAVGSPVIISGSSSSAHQPVGYEIVTDRKVVIAVGLVDAGCAPECAGDFTIAVPYALDEQGRQGWVSVFTQGSDGERQNVIHYRVSLAANGGPPALPRDVTSKLDRSFVLPEVEWIASGTDHRVPGISHNEIRLSGKSAAWDGGDGIVYVTQGEQLRWITPDLHRVIRVLDPISGTQYPELLDAGRFEGRTLAALSNSGSEPMWIDLATGETVEGPRGHIVLGDRYEITVDGLTAYIEEPGIGLPRLVVADADGVEVLRTTIGNELLPRARLHDFDGRRLIYSLGPNEPPGFWAVALDLECPTCTRVLYDTRPTFYDLVGSEPAVSGPPTCSTSGLVADLDPHPDLPAPAARTRQAIFDAAMACDFPGLLALSGYEPRHALLGADGDGWIEQELRHVSGEAGGAPVLQAIVEHLNLPYEGPFGSEQLIVWTSEANELVIDAYGAWVSFGSPD